MIAFSYSSVYLLPVENVCYSDILGSCNVFNYLFLSFTVYDKKASIDGHENGDLGNSTESEETVSKLAQSAESLA